MRSSIVAALALLLILAACDEASTVEIARADLSPPRIEVEVMAARREKITATTELSGNLLPRRRSVIVSEVDGVIEAIPKPRESIQATPEQLQYLLSIGIDLDSEPLGLDIGDKAPMGAVLVQLERRDFELRLAASRARLVKTEADLQDLIAWKRPEEIRRLQALELEATSEVEFAKREHERASSLVGNAIALSVVDRRETDLHVARARLSQRAADVEAAQAGPTEAALAVANALVAQAMSEVEIEERRLEKTTIHSPYDAVVTDRYVDVGERVTALPRVEILEIMDLRLLVAEVGVPERFVAGIHIGDRASVMARGLDEPAPGLVVLINDKVDPETRTFRARVALDNREGRFKAGQFARVTFELSSRADAITIPSRSLTYSGGHPQVFVYSEGRVKRRAITTGVAGHGTTEVLTGLDAGEQVVVHDPSILADGMQVTLGVDANGAQGPSK